jgi:hypothetical protein
MNAKEYFEEFYKMVYDNMSDDAVFTKNGLVQFAEEYHKYINDNHQKKINTTKLELALLEVKDAQRSGMNMELRLKNIETFIKEFIDKH